jgi:hypothetical protein
MRGWNELCGCGRRLNLSPQFMDASSMPTATILRHQHWTRPRCPMDEVQCAWLAAMPCRFATRSFIPTLHRSPHSDVFLVPFCLQNLIISQTSLLLSYLSLVLLACQARRQLLRMVSIYCSIYIYLFAYFLRTPICIVLQRRPFQRSSRSII